MRECTNCVWKGKDDEVTRRTNYCPVCGDNTVLIVEEKKKKPVRRGRSRRVNNDLNNDGKVDGEDRSIAARVLRTSPGSGRRTVKK